MGRVRDFTDAAKKELEELIKDIQDDEDGWWIFNDIGDWVADKFIDGDIENYSDDIKKYHREILDKKDTSIAQLKEIFANVYQVESSYSAKFSSHITQATNVELAFRNLAELMNPSPADGRDLQLARNSDEFSKLLNRSTSPVYDSILDKVVTIDDNGNPTYHWDKIEEILSKDPSRITEMEYFILASLFATMATADSEKFLQVLADKTGDERSPLLSPGNPSSYTTWHYNQDKLDGLQKYLNANADLLCYQYQVLDAMTPDELKEYFKKAYPDLDISKVDFRKEKEDLLIELDKQRLDILQKNALLTVAGKLEKSTDSPKDSGGRIIEFPGLNGREGASNPEVTLSRDSSGNYVLSYCNTSQSTAEGSIANNLNKNTVVVGPTVTGKTGIDQSIDLLEAYYNNKYSTTLGQNITEKGASYITEKVTEKAIESIADKVAKNAPSKGLKTAIGFIPIIGDLAGLGIDIAGDEMENNRNIREAEANIKSLRDASYRNKFQLDSNMILDENSKATIVFNHSPNTQEVLNRFNQYIKDKKIDLSKTGLDYPVTINDLYNYADELNSIINDKMSEPERRRVFR